MPVAQADSEETRRLLGEVRAGESQARMASAIAAPSSNERFGLGWFGG